jgi:hypothetical protein
VNEGRTNQPDPPGLKCANGQAQQVGRILFLQKDIWILIRAQKGHAVTASISMQQDWLR